MGVFASRSGSDPSPIHFPIHPRPIALPRLQLRSCANIRIPYAKLLVDTLESIQFAIHPHVAIYPLRLFTVIPAHSDQDESQEEATDMDELNRLNSESEGGA